MKVALGVEYDGTLYSGWQRQRHVSSVQQTLEEVLSQICAEPIEVFCAGRTDAGVHGTGQVVHFETNAIRKLSAFTLGTNTLLPDGIAIRWATEVNQDFHARFSATARRYRYIIYNHKLRPGLMRSGLSHYPMPLDVEKMQAASRCLIGEHDFSSFRAMECQSHTPWRNIMHLELARFGDYIVLDIKANAFVHHMVRNITGSLIEVGRGKQPVEWVAQVLAAKDRTQAGPTAKPGGLYLVDVDYPEVFEIPKTQLGPIFLPDSLNFSSNV